MQQQLIKYEKHLIQEEKSENTRKKYMRDIRKFIDFLPSEKLEKEDVLAYKDQLINNYTASSVNSMLAAVNGFLIWLGKGRLRVRPIKIQKEIFASPEKELTKKEYDCLIKTAEKNNNRKLSLLIQTICATGIRVSELKFITVDAIKTGRTVVSCKGKNRIIFVPKELCKLLKEYTKTQKIHSGSIFVSKNNKPLDRSNIWKMMKSLCVQANVNPKKVFPHNLRHLFARTYYKINHDISRLADILGHSSIDTTRIYIMETGEKHIRQMQRMNLIRI